MRTRLHVLLALSVVGMLVQTPELPACTVTCPFGDDAVTSALPGTRDLEINGDGVVGLGEFAAFGIAYSGAFEMCWDLNCDGIMSLADLAIFAVHYRHEGDEPTDCAAI